MNLTNYTIYAILNMLEIQLKERGYKKGLTDGNQDPQGENQTE